jgi:monothiol glutaredoxin
MSVQELARRLTTENFRLIDVRTAEERAKACIEGAVPLDQATMDQLAQLPRDTELAFICHRGNSSLGAAEYFRKQGFTSVSNVAGGIEAWSREIDPGVPLY